MKWLLLLPLVGFLSCKPGKGAQTIVDQSVQIHFMNGLDGVKIEFQFRDKNYSVKRKGETYIYTRSFTNSIGQVRDILVNSTSFTRLINRDTVELTKEWKNKYTSSVNSVLYFMQLPYVLNDPAVNKTFVGQAPIEGERYNMVKVNFKKAGGGEDYDDQFLFWFHTKDFTMDYFAYSYTEDEGGIRFRKAINRRRINGILFQDYINYEVNPGTPLSQIPALFKEGKLKVLSKIINDQIRVEYL